MDFVGGMIVGMAVSFFVWLFSKENKPEPKPETFIPTGKMCVCGHRDISHRLSDRNCRVYLSKTDDGDTLICACSYFVSSEPEKDSELEQLRNMTGIK